MAQPGVSAIPMRHRLEELLRTVKHKALLWEGNEHYYPLKKIVRITPIGQI